ncbi:MAG: cell division protein ZapA [Acidobacteria bacterium]|jgi:cell division protein ZapA|nr:cell division protein ZapA [Acidobacteriota bacterium]
MSKTDVESMLHESVEVTIFNQTYRLRSKTDKTHIQEIARIVDERMRQISSQITTHDVVKIAVLTAINIADEMQNLRNYYEQEIQPLLSKLPDEGEEANKESEAGNESEADKPQSWFDDFFDSKIETKNRDERLSSQISAKLQSLRQPSSGQSEITTEDEIPE